MVCYVTREPTAKLLTFQKPASRYRDGGFPAFEGVH
jgi:hypothetical protein